MKHIPVTENANKHLSNDDTNNLHVVDGSNPGAVAYLQRLPAVGEGCLE